MMKGISKIRLVLAAVMSVVYVLGSAGAAGAFAQSSSAGKKPIAKPPVLHNQTAKPMYARPGMARVFGGNGFTISLSANPQYLWQNQYSTITATTNADVGPTPYYISVY